MHILNIKTRNFILSQNLQDFPKLFYSQQGWPHHSFIHHEVILSPDYICISYIHIVLAICVCVYLNIFIVIFLSFNVILILGIKIKAECSLLQGNSGKL